MMILGTQAVNRMPAVRGLFLFILAPIMSMLGPGCAGKDFSEVRPGIETRGHYIENVPFHRQGSSDCGPAALASVLAFWGRPVSMEQITANIYLPQLRGTLPMDMERFARESRFETASSAGTLDRLKARLRADIPVICLVDLGFSLYRRPHYTTVIGFDDVNAVVIMHDGLERNKLMSYEVFDRAWARAGRWMLDIRPARESN
jgi:ABC-type bacteriocin/lantibiotic exporter with double-glycine peptidase domain